MNKILDFITGNFSKVLTLIIIVKLGKYLPSILGMFKPDPDRHKSGREEVESFGSSQMTAEGMKTSDEINADMILLVEAGFGWGTFTFFQFDSFTEDEKVIVGILNKYEPHNYEMLRQSYKKYTKERDLRFDCEKYLGGHELDKVSYLWLGG